MPAKMKLTYIDLLSLFKSPEYADIAQEFKEKAFVKKQLVCTPYEQSNSLLVVKKGRLRVFLTWEDREFTLALLEPGDIFSTHTRAFVETLDDSEILIGDTWKFHSKAIQSPEIAQAIVKVLGELLKNSITIIEDLAFKGVGTRLVDFLINAVEDRGKKRSDGISVELGLNMEEISLLIGTTRQTISTLLNELIKSDIIEKIDRRTLLIKDFSKLRQWNRHI